MKTEEFNTLLNSLTNGLPITIVVNRLALALREAIENGGEDAAEGFREFVNTANGIDSDNDF